MTPRLDILIGDAETKLREIPSESVQCCVTSPPYWALRDYGVDGQIGLEATVDEWLERIVAVFAEVSRVLKPDGTCWINLGDVYNQSGKGGGTRVYKESGQLSHRGALIGQGRTACAGLKRKDLIGIPWLAAFALQRAGWYLRTEIVWQKTNPMPESVYDRPTRAHEYIFLLSKSARYYFDAEALKEPVTWTAHSRGGRGVHPKACGANSRAKTDRVPRSRKSNPSFSAAVRGLVETRNGRSIWTFATEPYRGAHFATFPRELPRRCIGAGSKPGDTVLDPFGGSGTTGAVALALGRHATLIDLNPANEALILERCGPFIGQGLLAV